MRRLYRLLHDLAGDDGFLAFQNEVARSMYDALAQGYSKSENEVSLVERLVKVVQGKRYGPISLHGSMLHGPRSYVEFSYRDQPVTRELGDMALVSLVTSGSDRLLQRLTIIQNKKMSEKGWALDHEQLFMLKNFPPFSGNRGIFKGCRDVTFRDSSGCLGSYGLLMAPGEMLFASAKLISEFARGKHSLSHQDIALPEAALRSPSSGALPLFWSHPHFGHQEWLFMVEEWLHHMGPGPWPMVGSSGFLGNDRFARDIYDLTRSWTQVSLGEPTCASGAVVNSTVDAFTALLLRSAGMGQLAQFAPDNIFGDSRFDGQIAILAAHLTVE